jgi:small subunit ribosomal protein S6
MPETPVLYDLILLLSTSAGEEQRTAILGQVESTISDAGGSIARNNDWGTRPLTFKINHQHDAEYHLLQFTGPTALLENLSHSLRIADGVLRFRIIKNIPGTRPPSETPPPVIGAVSAGDGHGRSPSES